MTTPPQDVITRLTEAFDFHDPEYTPQTAEDVNAALREKTPVAYSPAHGGMWVLSRYEHVREALRDHETFSSGSGVHFPRAAGMPSDVQRDAGLFLDVIDENTTWQIGAPPVIPRLLQLLHDALQRAQGQAGRRPLVFVVLPTVSQVNEQKRIQRLQQLGFDPSRFARGLAQQRWIAVARELGITALDATPILAAEPDHAGLYISDGGHLSVRGNDVVARWLAKELAPLLR